MTNDWVEVRSGRHSNTPMFYIGARIGIFNSLLLECIRDYKFVIPFTNKEKNKIKFLLNNERGLRISYNGKRSQISVVMLKLELGLKLEVSYGRFLAEKIGDSIIVDLSELKEK